MVGGGLLAGQFLEEERRLWSGMQSAPPHHVEGSLTLPAGGGHQPAVSAHKREVEGSLCVCVYLQDLYVGLVRVGHLHAVDLYEAEGGDVVRVGGVLQTAHHLVHRGRLPRTGNPRDVHAPTGRRAHTLRPEGPQSTHTQT